MLRAITRYAYCNVVLNAARAASRPLRSLSKTAAPPKVKPDAYEIETEEEYYSDGDGDGEEMVDVSREKKNNKKKNAPVRKPTAQAISEIKEMFGLDDARAKSMLKKGLRLLTTMNRHEMQR